LIAVGVLNMQVFLSLFLGGMLGGVAGWMLQRWLTTERTEAMKTAWRQDMVLLEERLIAANAALRTEQSKVVQCQSLLSSTRDALRQKEGICAVAKADAIALKGVVAERDMVLATRTQQLSMERADVQEARRQISALKTELAVQTQKIAELEPLIPKLLYAESQLASSGGRGLAFPQTAQESCDDLKQIHGIGPVFEQMLNGIGIRYFSQIAGWTDQDIERVKSQLPGVKYRIVRDHWVERARDQYERKYGTDLCRIAS
jgi:predicted flap endonuclease-1-like 5' DNA nuclease